MWVYQNNFNGNFEELLRKEGAYYLLDIKPGAYGAYLNGEIDFSIYTGGGWNTLPLANFPALSSWRYVAVTYDGSFQKIYINGVEAASRAQTGTISVNINDLLIGQIQAGGQAFQGSLDDVAIYNRALSANEILDIYNHQK